MMLYNTTKKSNLITKLNNKNITNSSSSRNNNENDKANCNLLIKPAFHMIYSINFVQIGIFLDGNGLVLKQERMSIAVLNNCCHKY